MDEKLKGLMNNLSGAFKESLSDSRRIAEAVNAIERAGYDISVIFEITVGLIKLDEAKPDTITPESTQAPGKQIDPQGKVRFSETDERFLKSLRIDGTWKEKK